MGEWKVTCNVIDGKRLYSVYRLLSESEVDHSGNRELYGGYRYTYESAQALAETIKQEGGEGMIQIGELVSWQTQGGGKKKIRSGIAKAVIEPGQKATEVYPELACVPSTRRNFKLISSVKRVMVEEPRDSFNGRRHYSKFYAPPLAVVEKYAKEG